MGKSLIPERSFWTGRRVLVTGHTGFKGSWLALWLARLGARVTGYALEPSSPSLFADARVAEVTDSVIGDVRDAERLGEVFTRTQPEVVLHLAAQALVRESYRDPVETFTTNVVGTAQVLELVHKTDSVVAAVVVTSDKCYENREQTRGYRESDRLGGRDPYSSSKACAELVTSAYRESFLAAPEHAALATARAGNVVGGGDWGADRLVPDIVRAALGNEPARIRNPDAIRPWQHVVEPLWGYLSLVERLCAGDMTARSAWNFGPSEGGESVRSICDSFSSIWGQPIDWALDSNPNPHEAQLLQLDSAKARESLGWEPRLEIEDTLRWTVEWYREFRDGADARTLTETQLLRYEDLVGLT
ncbi:MAG: CDP-glucose 4,6-dehydratase [Acidobacteriota bacterium]|nr:CDP-glucose 4,6-dehydratase [Acidobacteriota bacterium]